MHHAEQIVAIRQLRDKKAMVFVLRSTLASERFSTAPPNGIHAPWGSFEEIEKNNLVFGLGFDLWACSDHHVTQQAKTLLRWLMATGADVYGIGTSTGCRK